MGKKLIEFPSTTMLAGSFNEIPDVAVYPYFFLKNGEKKVGCDTSPSDKNTEATITSPGTLANNKCHREVNLVWNPPQKCTNDQITSGETSKCRVKEDIYFFTFTMGNTRKDKFWVGQNSFGFYVDHEYE